MKQQIYRRCVFFVIGLMMGFGSPLEAQNALLQRGDEMFSAYDYKQAIVFYQKAFGRGGSPYYLTRRMGDAYRMLRQWDDAELWYRRALSHPNVPNEVYMQLGEVLCAKGDIVEGHELLAQFYRLSGFTMAGIAADYRSYIDVLSCDSARCELLNMPMNGLDDEVAPFVCSGGLYFSSNRAVIHPVNRKDVRNGQSFFDIYVYRLAGRDSGHVVAPPAGFNSPYNDGPVWMSDRLDVAYITRNRANSQGIISVLDVMELSIDEKGQVAGSQFLPFGDDDWTVAHACLSSDGRRLFFSAQLPGGKGGLDLYMSEFRNGFWGRPLNLGEGVNTAANECFPFLTADGLLFFSSNGWPGLGGYDLFYSVERSGGFEMSFNLGVPLNSACDDTGLFLFPDMKNGFLTSNRPGGQGGDDIYRVSLLRPLIYTRLQGQVIDVDGRPVGSALVTVVMPDGREFNRLSTTANGEFLCFLPPGHYRLCVRKHLFEALESEVVARELWRNEIELTLKMNLK